MPLPAILAAIRPGCNKELFALQPLDGDGALCDDAKTGGISDFGGLRAHEPVEGFRDHSALAPIAGPDL
jgi:hypothetical protein